MFQHKSQTATEYLVILAVVIVIALIVVGVLGGIPSIGGNLRSSTSSATLISKDIAMTNHIIGCEYSSFTVQNNLLSRVRLENISIGNFSCPINSDATSNKKILKPGESFVVNCYGYYECETEKYSLTVDLNYTDISVSASYFESYDIQGDVPASMSPIILDEGYNHFFKYIGSGERILDVGFENISGWDPGADASSADVLWITDGGWSRYIFDGSDWVLVFPSYPESNVVNLEELLYVEKNNGTMEFSTPSYLKYYGKCLTSVLPYDACVSGDSWFNG